jgi:glutaminyl-peptide cyclotransferase
VPIDSPAVAQRFGDGAISGERALAYVSEFVALGPRVSGTTGAERAAEHLKDAFAKLGLDCAIDAFEDKTPAGAVTFRNVVGTIPGRGEGIVVLGSHYDTKSGIGTHFVGANDSGSSTGLLLELASVLGKSSHPFAEIRFIFFDGEEAVRKYGPTDGLHGSRRAARLLKEEGLPVRAVIIMDMVGDRDLKINIPRNCDPSLTRHALDAAAACGVRNRFGLMRQPLLDDHVPFLKAGLPAIDLIDFSFGSKPGKHDYWHTEQDTLDKLSAESLETVGRVVIELLNRLSPSAAPAQ